MMHELFMSPFFGIGLSIAAFWVGTWIRKKTGLVLCLSTCSSHLQRHVLQFRSTRGQSC